MIKIVITIVDGEKDTVLVKVTSEGFGEVTGRELICSENLTELLENNLAEGEVYNV